MTKLGKATGGVEPDPQERQSDPEDDDDGSNLLSLPRKKRAKISSSHDSLALPTSQTAIAREVRVERDAEGRIVRVLSGGADNPLGDPLNELDSDSESDLEGAGLDPRARQNRWEDEWAGIASGSEDDDNDAGRPAVIRELEREARRPVYKLPRQQSGRELGWLERLVEAHGEDTEAMARDGRLNPMQQTAGDLARRIRKMKKGGP